MNRLRHPVRAIREPFGTAGLIVALIALVAALGGTALAAKGALTGKQKKEVEKIAKKYAGKPGAPGATGPAGAAGAAGKNGTDGTNGTNGTNGKSVEVTEIPIEDPECAELGGAMVTPEGGAGVEVCNGEEGAAGSPWPGGGVLASKATEVGSWAGVIASPEFTFIPISFPIQLPGPLDETNVHIVEGASTTSCPGSSSEPKAAPGNLCVYVAEKSNKVEGLSIADTALGDGGTALASRAGALVTLEGQPGGNALGTFAVTAP